MPVPSNRYVYELTCTTCMWVSSFLGPGDARVAMHLRAPSPAPRPALPRPVLAAGPRYIYMRAGTHVAGAARGRPSAETLVETPAAAGGGEGSRVRSSAAGTGPGRAARGTAPGPGGGGGGGGGGKASGPGAAAGGLSGGGGGGSALHGASSSGGVGDAGVGGRGAPGLRLCAAMNCLGRA